MIGKRIQRPVAVGGIVHETHSFVERPTTLPDFQAHALHYGDSVLEAMAETRSTIGGMIARAAAHKWRIIPTIYGAAMPGGIVSEDVFQTMLHELLSRLAAAGPVAGVLLALHGAMVTEKQLDPEGHILEQVRHVVGSSTPIVAAFDMHANVSNAMVDCANVLLSFDTNPHVDTYERGVEAATILQLLLTNDVRPTAHYLRPPIMLPPQATGTDDLPLRVVHDRARMVEADTDVIAVSIMAGFAYADTPFTGASLVVTTNNAPKLARRYVSELATILIEQRHSGLPELVEPKDAVARALAQSGGPVILVDSADNIGGGTPGDGTDALRAMLDVGVREGTMVLTDPEAVAICWEAGENARVVLEVGGKADRYHGEPVSVTGVVQRLSDGIFECELPNNHFASFYGTSIQMGRTAWLRVDGVNIILIESKTPPFDLAQLRSVGVIPEEQKIIVVKSAIAYRAAYLPIAAGVIEMDTAGLCSANLTRFPYKHISRPIFPLDEEVNWTSTYDPIN